MFFYRDGWNFFFFSSWNFELINEEVMIYGKRRLWRMFIKDWRIEIGGIKRKIMYWNWEIGCWEIMICYWVVVFFNWIIEVYSVFGVERSYFWSDWKLKNYLLLKLNKLDLYNNCLILIISDFLIFSYFKGNFFLC